MDTNPYESPLAASNAASPSEDNSNALRRHPVIGCFSLFLVAFVLFFGLAGLFTRLDTDEELTESIVMDVLVGVAIIGIAVLNCHGIFRSPRLFKRMAPAFALALVVSGLLVGWHNYLFLMREQAIEAPRQLKSSESVQ